MSASRLRGLLTRRLSTTPTYIQDGPPPGGYPQIKYKRNIPDKGPSNVAMTLGLAAFVSYGWYFTIHSIYMRNNCKTEMYDTRMTLLPYLQAEEDIRYLEVRETLDAKEKELMQDVPGWEVNKPVFDTVEWVRPKALAY